MREAGYIVSPDGYVVAETLQCVHCQGHWVPVKGSGALRGFCLKCAGVTCGKPSCESECVPFGKWLEKVERGQ